MSYPPLLQLTDGLLSPGMTTANMKLVILGVTFPDKLELSDANLEEGEHIVKRVVALHDLTAELQGPCLCFRLYFISDHHF